MKNDCSKYKVGDRLKDGKDIFTVQGINKESEYCYETLKNAKTVGNQTYFEGTGTVNFTESELNTMELL